ncbi:protein Lines homolog 1 [Chanos chanos]|uniref:Protein Lines homolog 1 n=1 Tax=Chanos chanos TaxID=29144 RepID=A0A6J2UKZ7_CHACN|nr:protein Lines homolog 1 [Chanos chanos]
MDDDYRSVKELFQVLQSDVPPSTSSQKFATVVLPFLGSQDRLLSHLVAKCVSSCVIYDIHNSQKKCSSIWREMCLETFQRSYPCIALDACLWSLTAVIKGVLRGDHECKNDILLKLLADFDPSLSGLYSKLFPQEKPKLSNVVFGLESDELLGTTLCSFTDLLEVLIAARIRLGICFSIQRLLFVESSAFLHVMEYQVVYAVKKQAMLLLKRSLLQKAGEDWASGEMQSGRADSSLSGDMCALADSVLQGVNSGLLQCVPVMPHASFFGGSCETSATGSGKDDVMLRAVSLILLKSLGYKSQSVTSRGVEHSVDTQWYLTELLPFLKLHGTQLPQGCHHCSWMSLVFREQDDDMIEAANTLLSLSLFQRSLKLNTNVDPCSWGGNPHCHFALLLKSVSFDHTVLLDFLISSETCFLEYCVRYLKLLHDDWWGFNRSCQSIEERDSEAQWVASLRRSKTENESISSHYVSAVSHASKAEITVNPVGTLGSLPSPQGSKVLPNCLPRLVDYESSEDSEEEEQSILDFQTSKNTDTAEMEPVSERKGEQIHSRSFHNVIKAQTNPHSECLSGKVMSCLMELRAVIIRLHKSNLFPYNPTSLLKLLSNIEDKSRN